MTKGEKIARERTKGAESEGSNRPDIKTYITRAGPASYSSLSLSASPPPTPRPIGRGENEERECGKRGKGVLILKKICPPARRVAVD